jgi:hypothetical protein
MTSAEFHGAQVVNPPGNWESEEAACTPLYVEFTTIRDGDCFLPTMKSVWVPSPEERAALAAGANIALTIVGIAHPPVRVALANVEVVLDDDPFKDWKKD